MYRIIVSAKQTNMFDKMDLDDAYDLLVGPPMTLQLERLLTEASDSKKVTIRTFVSRREDIPHNLAEKLSKDPSVLVREELAEHSHYIDILDSLLSDHSRVVQKSAEKRKNKLLGVESVPKQKLSPWKYVVYAYDLEYEEEIEPIKSFSSLKFDDAVKYATNFAKKNAADNIGSRIIAIPKNENDPSVSAQMYNAGIRPYEIVWASYE